MFSVHSSEGKGREGTEREGKGRKRGVGKSPGLYVRASEWPLLCTARWAGIERLGRGEQPQGFMGAVRVEALGKEPKGGSLWLGE